jgi:Domain of unknown function (DUF3854)
VGGQMRSEASEPQPTEGGHPTLNLLLSCLYDGALAPEHRADLANSGLTDETIAQHKIRSVPPSMIARLLGFGASKVTSAYIIPFPDPQGGWMSHVRLKVFPAYTDGEGRTVKYLGPKGAAPRLYFPILSIPAVTASDAPLWCVEGAKKALAVAQLRLPTVGFEGIEGWHTRGTSILLADFDTIPLRGRWIELVPDGDVQTNPNVRRGAIRLADAFRECGAHPRLVRLPALASRQVAA